MTLHAPLPPGVQHDDLAVRDAFVPRMRALAAAVGVHVPDAVTSACGTHYALLVRWNKTHNLSRIVDIDDAALKHYLDCAIPLLHPPADLAEASPTPARVIDVGSGAGFPGLVARIVWEATGWRGTPWARTSSPSSTSSATTAAVGTGEPIHGAAADTSVGGSHPTEVPIPELVLVEPARKRQSFLKVAVGALGLSGVQVVPPPPAGQVQGALVMTRATFSQGSRQELWPYVASGGVLLAWTTPHERSMWQADVATWPHARATWTDVAVGELPRSIFCVQRVSGAGKTGS